MEGSLIIVMTDIQEQSKWKKFSLTQAIAPPTDK